jgi:hypothetical protein
MIVNRFTHKHSKTTGGLHGGGFVDETVRKGIAYLVKRASPEEETITRPGYLGEKHVMLLSQDGKRYANHNFSGPGTNVDARLARGDKPVDQVDACSMLHDISYNTLTKAVRAKKIDRKTYLQGVKSADDKFRACASSVVDRPKLGKIASTAIGAKAFAEDIGLIPVSIFSGGGKKDPKPADKLRRMAMNAVRGGSMIVRAEPDEDIPVEKSSRKKVHVKGITVGNSQAGGFAPLLIGLAGSLLAGLAEKGIEKLIEHFSGKKGGGLEGMSKQDKIEHLLKTIDPTMLINEIQSQ